MCKHQLHLTNLPSVPLQVSFIMLLNKLMKYFKGKLKSFSAWILQIRNKHFFTRFKGASPETGYHGILRQIGVSVFCLYKPLEPWLGLETGSFTLWCHSPPVSYRKSESCCRNRTRSLNPRALSWFRWVSTFIPLLDLTGSLVTIVWFCSSKFVSHCMSLARSLDPIHGTLQESESYLDPVA